MTSKRRATVDTNTGGDRRASIARGDDETYREQLQIAASVEGVLDVIRRSLSKCPAIGKGAIFLAGTRREPTLAVTFDGPEAADLQAPAIELTGMARRAVRERQIVRQSGVSAGLLWAVPLESPDGIEGIVAGVGELGELPAFLRHAGLALFRERVRDGEMAEFRSAETRAIHLERAAEILDQIAREGGTDAVLRRVTGAVASGTGIGRTALWTLRAEDGLYVDVADAGNQANDGGGPESVPPVDARRAEAFHVWHTGLPRWSGCAWAPAGTIERPRPGPGDALVLVLAGHDGSHPLGFFVAELIEPPTEGDVEEILRWVSLGRLALENRSDVRRTVRNLEELREEKEQISELHRLKSQFIAAVSHELRTPLTSITAYAETLRSHDFANDDDTKNRFLRVIHDESRRLTRIVDDILDLATMDSGRVRISSRRVDLTAVIHDALDVIRPLAEENGVEVHCPRLEEAEVHADPDLLKQLTVNLLDNAVKFTPRGGHVSIGVQHDTAAIRLVVEDDGPGIPDDCLDAIFDRFYQVDGSNARKHGGSGLGLAICRSIATWHDGRVWVESEEGEGARFIVSLPRIRATSRSRAEKPVLANQEAEDNRIPELIIEMISEVMCADTVSLMLLDAAEDELLIQAAIGIPDSAIREARVAVGDRIAGAVAKTGETLFIPDLDADERFEPSTEHRYRTRSLLSTPVKLREKTIGVINVTNKMSGRPFSEHDRLLLEMLAQRVALVLSKLREFGDSRDGVKRMEDAIRGVIDVRRHYYPSGEEFSRLVLDVCAALEISPEETARIHYASILRDVGMVRLPEGIYKKPTELTRADRELIKRHPEEGAKVLRPIEFLPDVFDIILSHHEGPDGSGYPRGLMDEGIPRGAKILGVVDAYHSLRTGRPYRRAVGVAEAIEELRENEGKQFDPEIVGALIRVLKEREELVPSRLVAEAEVDSKRPEESHEQG